jgi:hypothetical protein
MAASALKGSDLRQEASRVPVEYTAKPDPDASRVYHRLLKVFEGVYRSLKSTFQALSYKGAKHG